ncbi:hypothetical protein AKJ64_00345 [candidate division MSBL1 archaeon SCGC-AAA259E17]|uniref:Uncharacterized protein n=1 Tax=candidate division MSBL1 archaeon SCGC-AAA259E17 TaxID=1698263 RepID=A0A133UH93_9EURY|nr:hypothetical protein AKJ64_00345 [candidate division MSBL1 archaeon SCGC-AAA259E17]
MKAITKMNGVEMTVSKTYNPVVLAANSDTTIPFKTEMTNSKLVEWWPTHIQNGETTNVKTDVYMVINYGKNIPAVSGTWEKKVATLKSTFSTNLLG